MEGKDTAHFRVTVTIEIKQQYSSQEIIKHVEAVEIPVADFPGVAKVLSQFNRAYLAVRKIGKVR